MARIRTLATPASCEGITAGANRSELVEALVASFDVDAVTAGDAVDGFVEECRRRRLVL